LHFARQAFDVDFFDIHFILFRRLFRLSNLSWGFFQTLFSPYWMVRAKGLEPPHLSVLEPKSSASTNSATPAKQHSGRFIAGDTPDD
jgi:hypothetical protein